MIIGTVDNRFTVEDYRSGSLAISYKSLERTPAICAGVLVFQSGLPLTTDAIIVSERPIRLKKEVENATRLRLQ